MKSVLTAHWRSAAHRAAFVLSSKFEVSGFDLCEQAGRDEAIAEEVRSPRERRKTGVRPYVDIVFGYDHPASCIVETNGPFDLLRKLNPDRIVIGRCMGDRQKQHQPWPRLAVAGGHKTGRPVLSLIASSSSFMGPKAIIADDEAGLRLRKGHLFGSFEQFVERGMFGVHLGPFNGLPCSGRVSQPP